MFDTQAAGRLRGSAAVGGMARSALLILSILAAMCASPVAGDHSGPVFTITTCEDLQLALATPNKEGFVLITLSGQVKCSAGQWSEEVLVQSHVEVVGSRQRRGGPLPSIDFDNAGHLIHITSNASLRFESVILVERTVDSIGRLSNLNFISGDEGAMFSMSAVVIHYKLCPVPEITSAPTTPTHTRIARSRNEDAGTLPSNNSTVVSPHVVIKSVDKEEAGVRVFMCESLVACGVLNATVLQESDRLSRVDGSTLCRFPDDARVLPVAPAPPVAGTTQPASSEGGDAVVPATLVSGQQPAPPTSSSDSNMWVYVSIGAVGGVLVFLAGMLLVYKRKHSGQRNKFITTTMIDSDSGETSGSPALGAIHVANPPNPFDQIPNKMISKTKKPPPYGGGGPSVSGLLSSWDMPEMGNIRVIRELPMSEAAPSEYTGDVAGADMPVKLQLAGLDVQLRRFLGNGGHTSVYEGVYKHMECAMKVVEHDGEMLEMHGEAMEDYLTKDLVHPNVVKLCAARTCEPEVVQKWLKNLNSGASTSAGNADPLATNLFNAALLPRFNAEEGTEDLLNTFVVMEYCNGGTLAQALHSGEFFNAKKPNMPMVLMRAIDIAHAMEHLHAHCVVHGDLKPDNVLLHRTHHDSCGFVCKVVDFGLRPRVAPHMLLETMSLATMAHLPPELLSSGAVSVATDVYSFGMILWGLVSGSAPFGGLKRSELLRHVVAGDRPAVPQSAPTKYARLIEECWHQEPMKRPDFRSITDRLRAIMFELERSSSSRPSSQSSRPTSQASNRPKSQASSRPGADAATKNYDTSDTESSVDGIEDGFDGPMGHGNPRQLRFAPGAKDVARRASRGAEREPARGGPRGVVQPVERGGMSAGPRRVLEVPPRLNATSMGSSNGNWEYDGDEERDSVSTLPLEQGGSLRRGVPAYPYGPHAPERMGDQMVSGNSQWSSVTEDDLELRDMDIGRRPQMPGAYRASD